MTHKKHTILICDKCGERIDAGPVSVDEARESVSKKGWSHDLALDFCPDHERLESTRD